MSEPQHVDVLGMGNVFVDDLVHVDHYPPPDGKAAVKDASRQFGGLIGSALAAAARLGASCAYAGVLDDDELSAAVCRGLEQAGVQCRITRRPGARPGHSIIIADDTAHTRNIFYDNRRMAPLPAETIDEATIAAGRVLLIDQLGMDTALRATRLARGVGRPVVADPEWPQVPGFDEWIDTVDHLIVGRDVAAAVSGQRDPPRMVAALHRRSPRACTAVTAGSDGCFFTAGPGHDRVLHVPAIRVKVVNTTGCGDVFHGAYAAALARGEPVERCIRTATAAAAVYASRPGGWQYLATAADVAALPGAG